MGANSFSKIMKGIGKKFDDTGKVLDKTANTFNKGVEFAKKANDTIMRDLTPKELEGNYSILQNITKRKAKTSANLAAFGGLSMYGFASGAFKEGEVNAMGTVEAGQMADTTDSFLSPTLQKELERQSKNEDAYTKTIERATEKYGSAGPDIVFALHELRNR